MPTAGTTPRRTWWRWPAMSQVERVESYTRQSLLWGLVGTNTAFMLSTTADVRASSEALPLLVGGAAVTAAGAWTLSAALDQFPATRPLPSRPLGVLLAVCAAYVAVTAASLTGGATDAALAATVIATAVSLGVLHDDRLAGLVIAGSAAAGLVAGGSVPALAALALFCIATARVSMWVYGIVRDLDEARSAQSELAVAEERLRFSRDVHDVLGLRLSTIAVQAELAAALAQRGDASAPERMLEVRGVAHQALREARELARGYRPTDFRQELDGARSLLHAAGIEATLAVDELPHGWHEPAAWIVRECVTNVLRHSRATAVTIGFSGGRLRVENDGVRGTASADGAGLRGLAERLEPLGASLRAQPSGEGRWSVVAELPGAGPVSAQTISGSGRA